MVRILVPDYLDQSIYAAIRSLGRHGDRCEVAGRHKWLRRYLKGRYVNQIHPTAEQHEPDRFVTDLLQLCGEHSFDVLMPFSLESMAAICPRTDQFSGLVRLLVPTPRQFALANDKLKMAQYCESVGISCPKSYSVAEHSDLQSIAADLEFPLVIKARSGSGVSDGLRYATSREELYRYYDELAGNPRGAGSGIIVQEFVPGYIHDACTLSASGEVLQVLTQVRKLMYPIGGGVGAINYTTHEPELVRIVRQLLESLEWNGPAQIEFKYDERHKRYRLIELNPKFWGTLDLSIKAGIDFPGMLRDLLLGKPFRRNQAYPSGIRYKFLLPRTVFSYLQLYAAMGAHGIQDPQQYRQTFYDLDPSDPVPDLLRIGSTLYKLLVKRPHALRSNLPPELINRIDRILPDST